MRKLVDTKNVVMTKPESSRFESRVFSLCACRVSTYGTNQETFIDFTLSGGINGETA